MKLVFDAGGTNLRVAVSLDGKALTAKVSVPTPKKYSDALAIIHKAAEALASGKRISAIVGGAAGPFDHNRTRMLHSPHLPGWAGKPLARDLKRLFRVSVRLENDSALAALGEATHGAGRGFRIVGFINIGTGIGGARVVGGDLSVVHYGFEPGHHLLVDGSRRREREWEAFVSGSAVKRATGRPSHLVTDGRIWKRLVPVIAVGLVNVIMFWSPDIIILGGSLIQCFPIQLIRAAVRARLPFPRLLPVIRRGQLGDDAGLYGALALQRTTKRRQQ
ncbi:MAG: ROK family protein [Candidatus Kerfeldbacteria bacterium]|nr:ROK family protein [Candidatus Kerfeldbacteria bacterium]